MANLGNTARKKLGDISNIPLQRKDKKLEQIPNASKEYIEKLQKENMALMKMLAERNKIIEITGVEIQKLRNDLQKMQQQNLQLAQANSKMLADLNSDKDRLKLLQHELGCRNGLLKARNIEAMEQPKTIMCQKKNDEVKPMECKEAGDPSLGNREDEKVKNLIRMPQSKSLGSSKQGESEDKKENKRSVVRRQSARFNPAAVKLEEDSIEDKKENKRSCVRRQSARFNPDAVKLEEDSFKVQNSCALRPPTSDPVQEDGSTSFCMSSTNVECNLPSSFEPSRSGRSSMSRPSRVAAKKVQSYKEIPVNMKMRRPQ